jgi:hypothetical protein
VLVGGWRVVVDVAEAEVDEDERAGPAADGVRRVQSTMSPVLHSMQIPQCVHVTVLARRVEFEAAGEQRRRRLVCEHEPDLVVEQHGRQGDHDASVLVGRPRLDRLLDCDVALGANDQVRTLIGTGLKPKPPSLPELVDQLECCALLCGSGLACS